MQERKVWTFAKTQLSAGNPVVLLLVTESIGSSPGRQGFKMVVNAEGQMQGSIGGGIMEQKWVERARKQLKDQLPQVLLKRQVHSKSAPRGQSGMICSGEQTLALIPLNPADLPTVTACEQACTSRTEVLFEAGAHGIGFSAGKQIPEVYTWRNFGGSDWEYRENAGFKDFALIIGGGHVGLEMSRTLNGLDFHVAVFDDRPGLNTMEENEFAHEKVVLPYPELGSQIDGGPHQYAIIMSFGYRTDAIALRQLIGKEFAYLGMMGSRAKIDQLFAEMKAEGFSETQLSGVRAPIGLPIGSRLPAEIAVSIAAEIIRERNAGLL